MKLVIQIPCLNEEEQLPETLAQLPRQVPGVTSVEWMVIDDGSTDTTVAKALENGVDHVVKLPKNKGLAYAFQAGLDAALKIGADIIVNTDADNQYDASCIADLVAPIVSKDAELVIGERDLRNHQEFSSVKIRLQLFGSWVVRKASATDVGDATTGFRAYSREAAIGLAVVNNYTYTIESIIQAGKSNTAIKSVPIRTNPKTRDSRLFGSMWGYVRRNAVTITRAFAAYEPLKFFGRAAAVLLIAAIISFVPFLWDWVRTGDTNGHLQSIILGAILTLGSMQLFSIGVLADLIYSNRVITQRALEKLRRIELETQVQPSDYLDLTELENSPEAKTVSS